MQRLNDSYRLKVLVGILALSLLACEKTESEENQDADTSTSPSDTALALDYENYYYSGCVAAHPSASYQTEMRRIIFHQAGTYEAETAAFDSSDCKTNLVAVIKAAGASVWTDASDEGAPGFRMSYTRDSLKVRVIHARELDAWNGIFTVQPVCDAFQSKLGDEIEMIDMNCLDAEGDYTLAPEAAWSEDIRVADDLTSIALSGLVFGHFPDMQAQQADVEMAAAVPVKTLTHFEEGATYYIGSYSYSSIANNAFGVGLQLGGSWQACHDGNLVTFTFSGNTYSQTGKIGMGADCSGSPAYTVTYSGTYSVPDGLDYVEGGYKINYSNSATKYTVHTTAALDELFNGNTAGTTDFCSGYTFTLDTETSLNGKSCKASPTAESSYTTVGSTTLYDVIIIRDNEIIDSQFTAEGQGSSDFKRPYFFNGELRYKKL